MKLWMIYRGRQVARTGGLLMVQEATLHTDVGQTDCRQGQSLTEGREEVPVELTEGKDTV